MNSKVRFYIIIFCCILLMKSLVLHSHFVLCEFDTESSIEMLHTQKIAHEHNEDADFSDHVELLNLLCDTLTREFQYTECIPCSDTHVYYDFYHFLKRLSNENDYLYNSHSVDKIVTISLNVNSIFISNTDIRQSTYQPTITILRI